MLLLVVGVDDVLDGVVDAHTVEGTPNEVDGDDHQNDACPGRGDLGRVKRRQRRKWFSRKYYASVMNLKEFYEENIGDTVTSLISDFARRCNNRH